MNRRNFIKKSIAAGIIFQLPWYISCQNKKNKNDYKSKKILNSEQENTISYFLLYFFPDIQKTPSIKELNTCKHINNYLADENINPIEKRFLINGIKWINDTSNYYFSNKFNSLSDKKKKIIITKILETNWGESWSSKLLTLTFESLLLDPLYHINTEKKGWKWLHHLPGSPRPTLENNYSKLLARKKENIIITDLSQL